MRDPFTVGAVGAAGAGIVGAGCFALILIWVLLTAVRTGIASVLVWLGWIALVWAEVVTVEPTFWPVVAIGFCVALVTGMASGGRSSSSD